MWTRRTALRAGSVMLLGRIGIVNTAARDRSASAAPAAAYCPSAQERAFLDRVKSL